MLDPEERNVAHGRLEVLLSDVNDATDGSVASDGTDLTVGISQEFHSDFLPQFCFHCLESFFTEAKGQIAGERNLH